MGAGLLLSVLAKHANFSNNPAWPFMADWDISHNAHNGGYNTIGLVLSFVAFVNIVTLPKKPAKQSVIQMGSMRGGIALGGVIFLLHLLATDAGTVMAWAHDGLPAGPKAMPHGALTILGLAVGLALSVKRSMVRSSTAFAVASLAAAILYVTKRWIAFVAGVVFSAYGLAILPSLLDDIGAQRPGLTFGLAMLTYVVLELVSVWTVAYAFVPAGWLLRERTDVMLVLLLSALSFAVDWSAAAVPVAIEWPHSTRTTQLGAVVTLLAIATAYHRRRRTDPVPYHPDSRLVTAGIWTVHFGLDGRMWESQRRMTQLIKEAELDVVGLLESDVQRIVMGNRDMFSRLLL